MSLLAGAGFVLLLAAAGWWLLRRLGAALAGPSLVERASLAVALGAAATGLVQVLASACGLPATAWVPAGLAALSLLLCRLAPGAPEAGDEPAPAPLPLPRAVVLLLVLVAVVSAGAAVGTPFGADGVRIWAAKARDLIATGAADAPSLHDPDRFGVHRRYPLLVPALLAPVFAASGPEAAAGPKLVLAALNLAILGAASGLLRRCGPRGLALLAALATVPLLAGLEVRESAVSGGYADSTDALFLLLVVAALLRLAEAERPLRPALLLALCGAALISTKLEGAVELLVVVVAALLARWAAARVLPAAAAAVLLAVPTFVIQAGVVGGESGFDPQLLREATALAARSLPVAAGLAGALLDASSFALLPLLLVALLLRPVAAGPAAPSQRRTRALALWMLAGALAFMAAAYLTTGMIPTRHLYTSAHRLLWHWLPALTLLAARSQAEPPAPPAVADREGARVAA